MSNARIGELLIANGLVSREQVAEALKRKHLYPHKPLGQVLRAMGLLQKDDLDRILDAHRKREKLGEILLRNKLIDEAKLQHALAVSKNEKRRLGETLLKLHYIEEEHIAHGIAWQYDLPFVSLKNLNIDTALDRYINANFALHHKIVAIHRKDDIVTVAMTYPLDKQLLQEIGRAAKVSINPVIATESEIAEVQRLLYRKGVPAQKIQKNLRIDASEQADRERSRTRYADEADQLVRRLLSIGVQCRASDVHLEMNEDGVRVLYRIDGFLQSVVVGVDQSLLNQNAQSIVSRIKVLCHLDISEKRRPQDGSFRMRVTEDDTVRVIDFRVSTLRTEFGEDVVIRILDRGGEPFTLQGLGFLPQQIAAIHDALATPSGFFLVTGPTGCGKSATLHAMLTRVSKPGFKTMTAEDPIEYFLPGVRQAEVNEAVGITFDVLLKTFMRQDPDHIMIGEIRDPESAGLAVRAALTGHTMFSTLQTNDSTSAVVRLLDMGVDASFIASTLRCVLAQRLVRVICPLCKVPHVPSERTLAKLSPLLNANLPLSTGKGCPGCNFTGFVGRRPISELWIPTEEELLHIYQRPDNLSLRDLVFRKGGRQTMLQDGINRVVRGETTPEELLRIIPVAQFAEIQKFKGPEEKS